MPDINNPVEFTLDAKSKIAEITRRPDFHPNDWHLAELESLRVEVRNHYRKEQRLTCVYCRQPVAARSAYGAPIEHIASRSAYPQFTFEPKNLCVVCPDCNEYKSNREVMADPVIRKGALKKYPCDPARFRIYHPHYDMYSKHIMNAGVFYFEITPKGAYTIYVCNLTRYLNTFGMTAELLSDLQALSDRHRFHKP